MKIKNLSILIFLLTINSMVAQIAREFRNTINEQVDISLVPRGVDGNINNLGAISKKMYISEEYKDCKIDGKPDTFKLRYNLYKDEMEFVKEGQIYYMKKEEGRTVNFISPESTYVVLNYDGKLGYFELQNDDDIQLLTKKSVRYKDAVKAKSSYDVDKPADFIKNDDINFIRYASNGRMIEIPTKRKKFVALFETLYSDVKSYIKDNKIDLDKKEDLLKVVKYFNSN